MQFYYILFLLASSILALNSISWFSIWIIIEINLIIFIPILLKKFFIGTREITLKYFIPQTFGSIFILISIIINKNNIVNPIFLVIIFSIGIFIKIGLIPFHIWIINIIEKINFNSIIILITWQKLIPLILFKFSNKFLSIFIAFISTFMASISAFYQNSMRKLMTYSSIINSRWIIIIFIFNKTLWIYFFILYTRISIIIIKIIKKENLTHLSNLFTKSKKTLYKIFIIRLTISGLPPSIGFILKLLILKILILSNSTLLIFLIIVSSIIRFLFYSRIFFSIVTLTPQYKKSILIKKNLLDKNIHLTLLFFPFVILLK